MKNLIIKIATLLFITINTFAGSWTIDGQMVLVSHDTETFIVKLQIKSSTGADGLGSCNFPITFNDALSFSGSYTFHNFSGGSYSTATVTSTSSTSISVNLILNSAGSGTVVASSWTDLATITFDVENTNGYSGLSWELSSMMWSLYDDDESTSLTNGNFTGLNTTPLPVELTSFNADVQNSYVKLNWNTATKINNYGFEIQRSFENSEFEKIGFVEGNGNSNSPLTYSYIDNSVSKTGKYVYRLKQIDFDGTFEYSEEVKVSLVPKELKLNQNFPNPFNPSTKISFSLPESGNVKLAVYNILGEEMMVLVNEIKDSGFHTVDLDASNLASGIYLYRLEAENYVSTKKMTLVK